MARFTREMARSNKDYIALYIECRDLLERVHHFEFKDVLEALESEAWAAHVKWDWVREWLEHGLDVLTEPAHKIDSETGEIVTYDKPVRIKWNEKATRKLNPLSQMFFNQKRKVYKKQVRRAQRTDQNDILSEAKDQLARSIVPDPETDSDGKRVKGQRTKDSLYVSECYASAKKVRGYCDDLYHGGTFAAYRKHLSEKNLLGRAESHDAGASEEEKLIPLIKPKVELIAAQRKAFQDAKKLREGNG